MELSARNQIQGKVKSVESQGLTAEVTVDIGGGNTLVSSITKSSADRLKLKTGDSVTVVIKASEVLIAK